MASPPLPTNPRNDSYTFEYTETRSHLHSYSDAFGTRPNSVSEDQQQRTLKGHTYEHKPAPEVTDFAGVRTNSYQDEPGNINRSRGPVFVNQEGPKPLSRGDLAGRPKSECDNDYINEKEKLPSHGDIRQPVQSYGNDDDDDDQGPPPISLNGDHFGMH